MRWPLKSGIAGILMTFPALFCAAVGAAGAGSEEGARAGPAEGCRCAGVG